jgi:hypothetical protein
MTDAHCNVYRTPKLTLRALYPVFFGWFVAEISIHWQKYLSVEPLRLFLVE